jgi:formylglycine-generating enzyme required for sulfatase activity
MSDHRFLLALALILVACLAGPSRAAAQAPWDERYYNPEPEPDDFILPMPCGAAMAFRQVRTPATEDLLEDYQVTLGQSDETEALSEYTRQSYLLGSLTQQPIVGRVAFFYLAKYEVTVDQYRAVMHDTCPDPSIQGRLPVTEVSWFDSVEFTRRYSEWLFQNDPESLPMEGRYRAFVRLPTEAEWEYAARGGNTVDPNTDFRAQRFPMDGPEEEYIWFQGPRSASGELKPVGLLAPNPLLLHDILGNAEEMVLEPFRVNRVGRRHGQVGGFVARGGSYLTPLSSMSTAERTEYSYFDETTGEARSLPHIGFRVAISAPVMVSQERIDAMREDWLNAQQFRLDTDDFNPVQALQDLADDTTDLELRTTLEEIESRFRAELSVRSEVEERAVRSAIMTGATLIRMLRNDHRLISAVQRAYEFQVEQDPQAERTQRLSRQLAAQRERADITYRAYLNVLVQAANDYSGDLHRQQLALQERSFEDMGLDTLIEPAGLFTEQVLGYQDRQELDREAYLQRILE